MAARGLDRADSDKPRAAVDMRAHLVGLHAAIAERDLPHLVAPVFELSPGKVVGAVFLRADDDVLAWLGRDELRGHKPGSGAYRWNQRDVAGCGSDQGRKAFTRSLCGLLRLHEVEPVSEPSACNDAIGLVQRRTAKAHGCGVEVGLPLQGRKEAARGVDIDHAK